MNPPANILLVSVTGIGNTIFFTPVARNLRRIFPRAVIHFLGSPATLPVVAGAPCIDHQIPYQKDGPFKLWRQWTLLRHLRRQKFDLAVCAFSERSTVKFSLLAFLSGAPVRAGVNEAGRGFLFSHSIVPRSDRHEVLQNLDILATVVPGDLTDEIFFEVGEEARLSAEGILQSEGVGKKDLLVAMHPGCTPAALAKRWPPENYRQLGAWLQDEKNARVVLVGGKAERELAQHIAAAVPGALALAGRLSLKQTAAVLERCRLFVGHDSGPMHMAAACAVPVVALFGPTNPEVYAPYCRQRWIITPPAGQEGRMEAISVERVVEVVRQALATPQPPAPAAKNHG